MKTSAWERFEKWTFWPTVSHLQSTNSSLNTSSWQKRLELGVALQSVTFSENIRLKISEQFLAKAIFRKKL